VSVCGDALTIRGEKKDERKESKGNYRLLERRYGTFQRTVSLPTGIDAEKVDAEFKNGVLSITLPKTEETRTKKIEIKKEGA
jgi:HSP20 family protein